MTNVNLISSQLQTQIYEHRQKMYWVFKSICFQQFCKCCKKLIIKKIYNARNDDLICCSHECVDNLYKY
jgi:hypothetical protein